ncbi:probable N-acetyltransferase HLS1-like [Abrus precatorius]|uniref:Probable N-acetyltransferase HLS1-like n=1 Tax=Abrus precatorius TaxID=3816 RepID=A0A8B8K7H4_ABRPR|nr:probable N-acetyltransferase HLS1-like [Abrus precatorius]
MVDRKNSKVVIREFNEDIDVKMVRKLERNCEIGTKKLVSIFTNMMSDPLSRIRLYPLHVMLVAELLESRELVGVIRGCIKRVGTLSGSLLKMGCILGLRVSPTYRRKGVALKLVTAVEEWMVRNGAEYALLATEKNNDASKNLFTTKCNYVNLSSLVIFVHPTSSLTKNISTRDVIIEKVDIDQAILLYRRTLRAKDLYPLDMDIILKEKLSLGTWVSYFKEEGWLNLLNKVRSEDSIISKTSSSWIIFSIWNNCDYEAYKLEVRKSQPLRFLHTTLNHAREKISPCLRMLASGSLCRSFGFLFLYGLHGEGENLGELMESIWRFTSRMGEGMKDCSVVITELGFGDPLASHVPQTTSMSCIDDLWYTKRLSSHGDEMVMKGEVGNVFVDPRDF